MRGEVDADVNVDVEVVVVEKYRGIEIRTQLRKHVIDDFSITLKNSDCGSPPGPILIYFVSFRSELESAPYLYRMYSKIKTSHQTICKKGKKNF